MNNAPTQPQRGDITQHSPRGLWNVREGYEIERTMKTRGYENKEISTDQPCKGDIT